MVKNFFDLSGKKALVTGASRGLGRYMSLALAEAGADVAITSRTLSSLEDAAMDIEHIGRRCFSVALDVTDYSSIISCIRSVAEKFGKIDILVSNAGMNIRKHAADVSWENFNEVLDTNLRGSYFVCQETARQCMIPNRYGRIITIGSANCLRPLHFCAPYAASRMGVLQMTRVFAEDWAQYGITANCIGPGWFPTQQTMSAVDDKEWSEKIIDSIPAGRFGLKNDLDAAVIFFASEASRYVTGQFLMVDGGFTLGDIPTPQSVGESIYK